MGGILYSFFCKKGKNQKIQDNLVDNVFNDYCFTIQGNIGCGKSTFLAILRQKIAEALWIEEPVAEWQNICGKNFNILQKYYQEPTRWGFTFQTYAIFSRIKSLKKAIEEHPQKIKISERSILVDKYVFSEIMREMGYMDECEYEVFKSLYKTFETMIPTQKTKIIYLRCEPEKCHERAKLRQRKEQKTIPLQYLELIHGKHEKWLNEHDEAKVLILNTTEDFKDNQSRIQDMVNKVYKFINSK